MSVFNFDPALPPLPIPRLRNTCETLKRNIKPLCDPKQFSRTSRLIDDFQAGEGRKLQALLFSWGENRPGNSSWLRPIWDDLYLSSQGPLPLDLNYSFELNTRDWGPDSLALLVWGLARTFAGLRTESLEPEAAGDSCLSMDTLRLAVSTRIPRKTRDLLFSPSLSAPPTVAVVFRGCWYIVSLTGEGGQLISPSGIDRAFTQIRQQSEVAAPGIASFTCAPRPQALEIRTAAVESLLNRLSLGSIERSLFVVCLDELSGQEKDFGHSLICGDPQNRWFDKSLQIIQGPGGRLGLNFEHSGCDATIWLYLLSLADRQIRAGTGSTRPADAVCHVQKLRWQISGSLGRQLDAARENFHDRSQKLACSRRKIPRINREIIKSRGFSPDAFAQILFQAAYFHLTGCFKSVYEAASTRRFYEGRTESVRPCTEASVRFVRAFFSDEKAREELGELLNAAARAHVREVRLGQSAQGTERHMAGLRAMYDMYKNTPEGAHLRYPGLFDDPGFLTLKHDSLSTSSVIAPFVDYFSYAPTVPDGLGIGYGFSGDALHVAVTSYTESDADAAAFVQALETLAPSLLALVDQGQQQEI